MGVFSYIKIGLVAVLVLSVGYLTWSYQDMRNENRVLKDQKAVVEANLKTAEKTITLLKEMSDVEEAIDNAPDDDVAEYLRTGVWPKRSSSKGDDIPSATKPVNPKESGKR